MYEDLLTKYNELLYKFNDMNNGEKARDKYVPLESTEPSRKRQSESSAKKLNKQSSKTLMRQTSGLPKVDSKTANIASSIPSGKNSYQNIRFNADGKQIASFRGSFQQP